MRVAETAFMLEAAGRRVVVGIYVGTMALASSACIFPSLDDLNGHPAGAAAPAAPDGGVAAVDNSTVATTTADPSSADAGTKADAADAGARFSCPGSSGSGCALGAEVCCGGFIGTECAAVQDSASCASGFLTCSDSVDCPSGLVCCGSLGDGKISSCKAACTGAESFLCDPSHSPAHCPNNKKCTGNIGAGIPVCE